MGLYDRDYYRAEEPGYQLSIASWTWTTRIIACNVAVYIVQLLTQGPPGQLGGFSDLFSLHADWWVQPWRFFELLTYGFLHSTDYFFHIVWNMLMLWFLGRELEAKYGPREFLIFYLAAIVVAGLAWSGAQFLRGNELATSVGASGGVSAVLVLFALNFPRRELLLWFVIPIPVWILAVFVVAMDIYGALYRPHNIGYEAHLGGALFALAYFQSGRRIGGWLPYRFAWPSFKRRPKLRVHSPEPTEEAMEAQVDEVLRKIQQQGQDSLTRNERRILEKASEEYKRRRT